MTHKQAVVALALIFVLALALRCQWALTHTVTEPRNDAREYDVLARNMLNGRGYSLDGIAPSAKRLPVYPLFLAGVYGIFGHSLRVLMLIQAGLGAFTTGVTYWIGRRTVGDGPGLLAALLFIVFEPANSLFARVMSEALYMPLLAVSILLLTRVLEQPGRRRVALLGVLLGVATLCRAPAICLPIGVGAALLALRRFSNQVVGLTLILLVSFGLVVSLWLAYNYARFDGRIMFRQDWARALPDEGDEGDDSATAPDVELPAGVGNPAGSSAIADSQTLSTSGIVLTILSNPLEYARIGFGNISALYMPRQANWRWLQAIELVLGMIGMAAALPAWRKSFALYLVIGAVTFIHGLTHGIFRYVVPIAPYWLLFAAAGIFSILYWLMKRFRPGVRLT